MKKRAAEGKKKNTHTLSEHKAYMLMCQLAKLAIGRVKAASSLAPKTQRQRRRLAANYIPRFWIYFFDFL